MICPVAFLAFSLLLVYSPVMSKSGLFLLTSDFETGSTAFLPSGSTQAETNLLTVHSDAFARNHKNRLYIVNRLGQDNLLVLWEDDLTAPLIQFSVGNGTNPHDVAVVNRKKAYVSRYSSPSLAVVNPETGEILREIDLSAFADNDGRPEMSQMVLIRDRLYVACQRLDSNRFFEPIEPSYVVVIDTATDTVVEEETITLAATNPASIEAVGTKLYLSLTASFGVLDGGVEIIDTATGISSGLVLTEADLGGDVTWLSVASSASAYAVVSDENFQNFVKPVDLLTATVGQALTGHSGGFTPSVTVDGERLIVPDRGTFDKPGDTGLLIYDIQTNQLTAGPIPVGLPPAQVVALDAPPISTAVEENDAGQSLLPRQTELEAVYPNPFNSWITIAVQIGHHESARIAVYNLLGQRLRVLSQPLAAGRHQIHWDGRDENGTEVGSGPYVITMFADDRRVARKVTYLK